MRMSEHCFHLIFPAQPFPHLLPARIVLMVDTKQCLQCFFFETAIGDFSSGYFMNKMNDYLMIGCYGLWLIQ